MMRWIVGSSLRFRFIIVALAGALMFFGVQRLNNARRRLPRVRPTEGRDPHRRDRTGADRGRVLITVPLEQALNGVPGMSEIRSKSVEQLSQIVLLFDEGTDLLQAAAGPGTHRHGDPHPAHLGRPTSDAPTDVGHQPVLKIGLSSSSSEIDMMDLSMTAYWKIRARLLRVPGVANVPIWGSGSTCSRCRPTRSGWSSTTSPSTR